MLIESGELRFWQHLFSLHSSSFFSRDFFVASRWLNPTDIRKSMTIMPKKEISSKEKRFIEKK